MIANEVFSFLFSMVGLAFIPLVTPREASTTYVLRNGVGYISWKIDRQFVQGYVVDVYNPMNKKIFHCFGEDPENIAEDFEGKIQFSGNYKDAIIAFLVLNATEEDAGNYRSVIDMTGVTVGNQLLVVFAPFPGPTILATRNAKELDVSSLTLMCQVETSGTPPGHSIPVSYTWRRNGAIVENSTKYVVKKIELRVNYLQRSDFTDLFTCLAWNDYGAVSQESSAFEISKYSMYFGSCQVSCVNGNCKEEGGELKCVCQQGWTGSNCSIEIHECSSNPCHKGECFEKHAQYHCVCSFGWTGKQCEIEINECLSSPCHHGRCEDLPSSYSCICDDKWTGANCETALGNLTSSTVLIASVVGAGCIIIAVFLLILGIWYRKCKARLYMNQSTNGEELAYHGVDRVQSGDYWTIDDEQLYDIRNRVKFDIPVEALTPQSSDGNNEDNPCFHTRGDLESVKDGMKTDAEGYLKPTFSI